MTAPLDLPALSGAMAKATPAPWAYLVDIPSEGPCAIGTYVTPAGAPVAGVVDFCDENEQVAMIAGPDPYEKKVNPHDFPLIVLLRNSAASLVSAAKERDALAAALGEARTMLNATSVFNDPQLPDERERLDLLARIDALLSPTAAGGE